MATLNLGRIKPVFRGAYAGGTAYVVDDIVTSGGETFICIQASTGNATSSASHWTKLAEKGTNGTNGTDVGTTITTQGDILYRDGSGLARLGAGTSGQFLKTQGTGANPVWATNESNVVKLGSQVVNVSDNSVSTVDFTNVFDDTVYSHYQFSFMGVRSNTNSSRISMRFMNGSTAITSGNYSEVMHDAGYLNPSNGTINWNGNGLGSHNYNRIQLSNWDASQEQHSYVEGAYGIICKTTNTDTYKQVIFQSQPIDSNAPWQVLSPGNATLKLTTAVDGVSFFAHGGYLRDATISLYGFKI